MENLESHGIYNFNFQTWKVVEFKWGSRKVMESNMLSKNKKAISFLKNWKSNKQVRNWLNIRENKHKHRFYALICTFPYDKSPFSSLNVCVGFLLWGKWKPLFSDLSLDSPVSFSAFENFQSAVNPPVISPTPCLKIRNMFDPDV